MLFAQTANRFRPGDTVVVKTMRQLTEENGMSDPPPTVPGSIRVRVRDGPMRRGAFIWVTPPMTECCGMEAAVLFTAPNGTCQLDICPEFLFPESMLERDETRQTTAVSDEELAVFLCLDSG